MKKFLLLAAGATLALAANADRYYVHGQIFGGGWNSTELKLNQANSKYEITGTLEAGEFGIKYCDDNGTQKEWRCANSDTNKKVDAEGTFDLYKDGGKNFVSSLEGNYTISLDVANNKVTFTKYDGVIEETVTYVLRGNFNSSDWADYEMTESDGIWSYTGNFNAGKEFGIKKMVGNSQKAWYQGTGDSKNISADGGTYEATDGAGGNFKIAAKNEYTIAFNPEVPEIVVTPKAGGGNDPIDEFDEMYLVGAMTGWASNPKKMTTTDGIVYTLNVPDMTTGEFKFFGGEWGTRELVYNGKELEDGTYTVSPQVDVNMSLKTGGNVTFTLKKTGSDWSSASLKIEGQGGGEPVIVPDTFDAMYLVGAMTDWADNPKKMTTTDGVVYTLNVPDMTTGPFKFFGGEWGTRELVYHGSLLKNGEYKVEPLVDVNMSLAYGGNVTFTLTKTTDDWSEAMLKIEGQNEDEPVVITYVYKLHGQFYTGEKWDSIDLTESETEEGVYIASFTPTYTNGSFGVKRECNGVQDTWWNDDVTFGPEADHKTTHDLTPTESGNSTFAHPANVLYDVKFKPSYNGEEAGNGTLTITKNIAAAISAIEAANGETVYFNLQGVKIEKPENGLFIEVRNGQTRKVMVK